MASARHVHRPSRRPRLRWTVTKEQGIAAGITCPADSSSATRAVRANRGRGALRAAIALALIALTFLLLPGQVKPPSGAPGNSRSLDRMSTVALYTTPYGGEEFSAHLSWSWRIQGGKSEPSLFAIIDSRVARGSLVLGGPISNLVSQCHLNGKPINPEPGMPNALGFVPPKSAQFWFNGREASAVGHIDYQTDPGSRPTVIRCDVRDFGSDAPPVHRLYTPMLLAYAQGSEVATEEDFRLRSVCVEVAYTSVTEAHEQCAERFNVVPHIGDREQLVNLPEEQGIRDAYLIVVGAVAGSAAAAMLEVLTGFFSAVVRKTMRMLRILKQKLGGASYTP